ncbi:MAG: fumarylacetoacetate hydrolase family protein [Prevotellaceae bacterium]|jgi:2-keto-4-pentenoate hydratase/2-oxohepta-3-ene-1,7-dioic acid hydratase in catechol pathway|nr:fumarylacetoacetate hydrolase family protein [Prevotellaceae bacterium]
MKIICIGHNYSEHNKELFGGYEGDPVFFMKPDTALLRNNAPLYYPKFTQDLQYEVELVLKICRLGRGISEKFAHRYYDQIGVGVDFTARDIQRECKEKGLPWELCKAFDYSAPISSQLIPVEQIRDVNDIHFSLTRNGEIVQQGRSRDMIFSFDRIVAYVSQFVSLKIGDLIFTGTPSGVGPVAVGDVLVASIEGQEMLKTEIK